jgi:hypothetical protein
VTASSASRPNAHRCGWLAGIALTCLIIGILFSVHITIHAG